MIARSELESRRNLHQPWGAAPTTQSARRSLLRLIVVAFAVFKPEWLVLKRAERKRLNGVIKGAFDTGSREVLMLGMSGLT